MYRVLALADKNMDWFEALSKNKIEVVVEFKTFEEANNYGLVNYDSTDVWAIDDGR